MAKEVSKAEVLGWADRKGFLPSKVEVLGWTDDPTTAIQTPSGRRRVSLM